MQNMQDFDLLCGDTAEYEIVAVRHPTNASMLITGSEREALREFGERFAMTAQPNHESYGRNWVSAM